MICEAILENVLTEKYIEVYRRTVDKSYGLGRNGETDNLA